MTSRLPRLALAAWTLAAAVFVALAIGVWHYLTEKSGSASGMQMGDALTRGGTTGPSRPFDAATLFSAWQLDAIAVAVIALAAAAYLTGVALVNARDASRRWPVRRTAAFLAGLAVCVFATNGSIAVYDQVLLSAHMVGHLALLMVAPALLIAGHPLTLALEALRPPHRDRLRRIVQGRVISFLTAPPVALASYTITIVGSHLTGLMDSIMQKTWAGQVEHLVYVLAGLQFFVLVVGNEPIRWRLASPARWLLLAIAMAVDTFTGIVLMQGTRAVTMLPARFHVDALADTHTGGAIMWVGGDAIMAVVMVVLVVGWLRNVERTPAAKGWLEQARGATFATHTGATAETVDDEAEDARTAYNAWLEKLNRS